MLRLGSVDTNIGIPMRGLLPAKEIWDYLEKVYQQSNLARKFQIEYDLFCYEQGEKGIQESYAGFMDMWAEYEFVNMANMTNACCMKSLKIIYDERKVMQFLMKLRSDYVNLRANILNRGTGCWLLPATKRRTESNRLDCLTSSWPSSVTLGKQVNPTFERFLFRWEGSAIKESMPDRLPLVEDWVKVPCQRNESSERRHKGVDV